MGLAYYSHFIWKRGVPTGVARVEPEGVSTAYRVVTDPYHKHYTVERYLQGVFDETVYDSHLLDFRKVTPKDQVAWKRETLEASETETLSMIRNLEDRVILLERYTFKGDRCRECEICSPVGLLVATQRIYYGDEGGNGKSGVVLLDRLGQVVMYKVYSLGEGGQFEDLLDENWDLAGRPPPFTELQAP